MISSIASGLAGGLVHLIVLAAILGLIASLARIILREEDPIQRVLRAVAAVLGVLAYLLPKALGFSVPEIALQALTAAAGTIVFSSAIIVLPSVAGVVVAHLLIRESRLERPKAARLLVFTVAFTTGMTFEVYLNTFLARFTLQITPSMLPVGCFFLGLGIYLLAAVKPKPEKNYSSRWTK